MYRVKKFDDKDKKIIKCIHEELEKITIPKVYCSKGLGPHHAEKTGVTRQRNARQCVFGVVTHNAKTFKTKFAKRFPHILKLFKEFMRSHDPSFKFRTVQVNLNCVCKKHRDSNAKGNNKGDSIIIALGKFTFGRTIIYLDGKPKKFNIKCKSLKFDGSKIIHASEKFKGKRYSLVFFR